MRKEKSKLKMPNGMILCTNSNLYQVRVESEIYQCLARGKFKKGDMTPLVGDQVEITITHPENHEGVIEKILPRKNELKRPKMANLTTLLFVLSMKNPKPDLLLLDKQLAFASWLGIHSIICFNKTDLENPEKIEKIVQIYQNIGYPVIKTSAKVGLQVEELKPFLKNQITAFAGNSGVGKSTLLNCLFQKNLTQEGVVGKNQRGKNTTTSVTLYEYDKNSYIADTPGFSTFDISEIPKVELDKHFIEFIPYIPNCKYGGCSHIKEEECAIKQAVEQGKIAKERYQNYQKIYQELKESEERKW